MRNRKKERGDSFSLLLALFFFLLPTQRGKKINKEKKEEEEKKWWKMDDGPEEMKDWDSAEMGLFSSFLSFDLGVHFWPVQWPSRPLVHPPFLIRTRSEQTIKGQQFPIFLLLLSCCCLEIAAQTKA